MLTYSFDETVQDSLYQHLYKCIKNDIIEGILKPGEKLPSKRAFSKNLGVSIITVENAYEQLVSEGYIYSLPKKGFYVSNISELFNVKYRNSEARIITEDLIEEKEKFAIDLTSNQANTETFPFSIWAKLVREVLNQNQVELVTSSPSGGIMELREAIAKHLLDYRDIKVLPEQIIIGAGTEYLYGLLIQLLGFDKKYAVEDPGYNKITRIYEKYKVDCFHIPLESDGISLKKLEESTADIIHISPSHNFPTGIITPIGKRLELINWASMDKNRYIIEDDYDSEFRMLGKPIPALLNIDVNEKVIYMNTFSKTLTSTIRISYMVLPMTLVRKFHQELSFYSCTVSNFEQYTLARFIKDGYFEKHINRMRRYYHQKRDLLISKIKESSLNDYASILEKDSGLHFILEIKTKMSDDEFCIKAKEKGVKISALSSFYINHTPELEHRFIVNYSSLMENKMDEFINIILALAQQH